MAKKKPSEQSEIEKEDTQNDEDRIDRSDEIDEEFLSADTTGLRIEIAREGETGDWEYYWMLYSPNGKQMATNPESYSRLNDLKNALQSIVDNIGDAPLVRLY